MPTRQVPKTGGGVDVRTASVPRRVRNNVSNVSSRRCAARRVRGNRFHTVINVTCQVRTDRGKGGYCCLPMGKGKTICTIATIESSHTILNHTVWVVMVQATLVKQWEREVTEWLKNTPIKVLVLTKKTLSKLETRPTEPTVIIASWSGTNSLQENCR